MTAVDHPATLTNVALPKADAAARMVNGLRTILRALFNRRHLRDLSALPDHHLADIGLLRSDLHEARLTGIGSDPTSTLSMLSRRRHEEKMPRRVF